MSEQDPRAGTSKVKAPLDFDDVEDVAQPKKRTKNPIPAVLRISREKAEQIWEKRLKSVRVIENDTDEELHCWFDTGRTQNGYPSASWSHTEANIQISHLALRVGGTVNDDSLVPFASKRETASHLCHNKLCIRPSHIVKESVGLNGRRNGCLAFVTCAHGERVNACGHSPRCILPFVKDAK